MIIGLAILSILTIYAFLSSPSMRKVDLKNFINWNYAHRGFHNIGDSPENSLLAIKRAKENGFGMEFDIRLTKDGQIVLFHDDNLKRMTGLDKNVRDLNYEEIKDLKLLNSDQGLPLFSEVLEVVEGRVPIIVELKCSRADVHELASKASSLLDNYQGPFMVESFNPYAVKWFRKNRPHYIRGQLSSGHFNNIGPFANFFMKELLVNYISRPDFIAYEHIYRKKITLWLQKHLWKKLMVCYTVKNIEDFKLNKSYFDLIIFESFSPK